MLFGTSICPLQRDVKSALTLPQTRRHRSTCNPTAPVLCTSLQFTHPTHEQWLGNGCNKLHATNCRTDHPSQQNDTGSDPHSITQPNASSTIYVWSYLPNARANIHTWIKTSTSRKPYRVELRMVAMWWRWWLRNVADALTFYATGRDLFMCPYP